MTNNLISVIIPVYKVEKYLDRCVESVVNQTYKNLEIILVDDGSPDNCPAMCDEWAKKDNRIKVIHKENGGVSSARNVGIDNATGEYIAFVDSDDYIDKTMYEKLLNKAKEENADMTLCRFLEVDENGNTRKINEVNLTKCNATNIMSLLVNFNTYEKMGALCLEAISGNVWRILYKKAFIAENRFEILSCAQDFIFNLSLFVKKPKFAVVDEYLHFYLQRKDSVVHSFSEKFYHEKVKTSKLAVERLEPFITKEQLSAYKFIQSRNIFVIVARSPYYKKLKKEYKKDKWIVWCNQKEGYKLVQKGTTSLKYKVTNWLAYRNFLGLFRFIFKLLKR